MTSKNRIKRIREQGYFSCTDTQISELAFGNRFAYILCSLILIYGVATANVTVLLIMLTIAFGGVILPNHPFDYIYNYALRHSLKKPKLPRRSPQLKFACTIATLFLIATTYLFYNNHTTAGYFVGASLVASAVLVSSTDICIPSILFNLATKKSK